MDSGPGPPQQSPDDYSARERRERTGVAVGISLGVIVLFAAPLCLVYFANWRRRRRNRRNELCYLEGATAVSHDEKSGTTWFERTGNTTLTTTLVDRQDVLLAEAEIAEWREIQRGRTETLERLKRDPKSPLNSCMIPKAKQVTPEEVLGLDKVSFLQNLPTAGCSNLASDTAGTSSDITVLPSRLPPYGVADLHGESSKQLDGSCDADKCVSPWAVEHEPNPVIFKHLLGPRPEDLDNAKGTARNGNDKSCIGSVSHSEHIPMNVDASHFNEESEEIHKHDTHVREEEESKESSAVEETSSSSPSSTVASQDSSSPLLSQKPPEDQAQSPTSNQDLYQQLAEASAIQQEDARPAGRLSCTHCSRTFNTTGQLNAHIYRKHVRRYSCSICSNTFHLKTDLKRHERTVHRNYIPTETQGFLCPNKGCSIPEKVFLRRDNFERHVSRCAQRVEKEDSQRKSERISS